MRARDLGIVIGRGRPGRANAITDVAGVRVGHATLDPRRRSARRRRGPGSDRRHGRRPARRRRLDRAGVRGLPPPQRQRRADGPRVGPRGRPCSTARSGSPTRTASGSSATRSSRDAVRARRSGRRAVVAARRRRDVGRPAQRHQRLPRDGWTMSTRRSPRPRRPGRGGQRRRRDRDGLPRVQGRDRHGVAGRRRERRRLDGRRARPGELRRAGLAPDRRRAGRRGDPDRPRSRARTTEDDDAPRSGAAAGLGLDHRRRRDGCAAAPPPVRARSPSAPGLGIARMGGTGAHSSGDLFIAFATGNRGLPQRPRPGDPRARPYDVRMVIDLVIDAAVRRGDRGDRGGDRQRARRRRDDDRPRRDHRPRACRTTGCST